MKLDRNVVSHPIAKYLTTPDSSLRCRLRSRACLPRVGSLRLLLLVCGGFLPLALPDAAAQTRKEKPAAVFGEEAFYDKDYLPQIQGQVHQIRLQEYELKRKALESVINKKLLRIEAEKGGMTEDAWLHQEVDSKIPEPSAEESEQHFVAQMFRDIPQITQTRDQIREQLIQGQVQQAREEYFRVLREKAGVKIYLLPPRMEVSYDPSRVRGNPDAKITIVEFSDFQCPFCLQAYSTIKNILKKYDGQVKLAYRDLPLQEIRSNVAGSAEASRCAGEQGKFWEYHDRLFENQDYSGEEAFKEYAETLELDGEQFAACLESGKFKPQITEDFQEGIRLGIRGTPAFFINGIFLNGSRPQSEFEEIIEVELATMDP